MKKTSKKVLSLIIAFLLLFLSTPIDAFSNVYFHKENYKDKNCIIKVKEDKNLSDEQEEHPVEGVEIGFYRKGETSSYLTKRTDKSGTIVLDESDLKDINGYCMIIKAPSEYFFDRNEEIKLNFNQSEELEIALERKPVADLIKDHNNAECREESAKEENTSFSKNITDSEESLNDDSKNRHKRTNQNDLQHIKKDKKVQNKTNYKFLNKTEKFNTVNGTGTLTITKISDSMQPLKGVIFAVARMGKEETSVMFITDENGKPSPINQEELEKLSREEVIKLNIKMKDEKVEADRSKELINDGNITLEAGEYRLVELKPAPGYKRMTSEIYYTVKSGQKTDTSETEAVNIQALKRTNGGCLRIDNKQVIANFKEEQTSQTDGYFGRCKLIKVDVATRAPIKGATIEYYREGEKTPFITGITNMDGKIDKTTATGEVERINPDGTITLEVGKYFFKEIKAPDGYILNDAEHHFEITAGETKEDKLENTKKDEEIKVCKTVEETGTDKKAGVNDIDTINTEIGKDLTYTVRATIPSNADRTDKVIITDELDPRLDLVQEKGKEPVLTVEGETVGNIVVQKQGEGVKITSAIVKDVNRYAGKVAVLTFHAKLNEKAAYDVKVPNKADYKFTNRSKVSNTVNVVPVNTVGTLTITKKSATTMKPLKDVIFALTKTGKEETSVMFITDENGKPSPISQEELEKLSREEVKKLNIKMKDAKVEADRSKELINDGNITLEAGEYRLVELKPAPGYKRMTSEIYYTVVGGKNIFKAAKCTTKIEELMATNGGCLAKDIDYCIVNFEEERPPQEGKLDFTKTDFSTSYPVEGATIEFYKEGQDKPFLTGITNKYGTIDKATAKGEKDRVNSDGTIRLEVGKYYFKETNPPEGYILNNAERHFEITEGKTTKYTLPNEKEPEKPGYCEITKVDIATSKPVAGATIEFYKEGETTPIVTGITNTDGHIDKATANGEVDRVTVDGKIRLEVGKYYFKETNPPEGYILNSEEHHFEITAEKTTKDTLSNEKEKPKEGKLDFTKTDFATSRPIAGATIAFYKEGETTPFITGITTTDGHIYKATARGEVDRVTEDGKIKLEVGKYYFKETNAPEGYILNDAEHHFEIAAGEIKEYKLENTKRPVEPGKYGITKVDASSKEAVKGATIEFYREGETTPFLTGETDENGRISNVTGETKRDNGDGTIKLEAGKYYFKETKAPDGYILNDAEVHFEITEGEKKEDTLENTKKPEEKGKLSFTKRDITTTYPIAGATIEFYKADGTLVVAGVTDALGHIDKERATEGKELIEADGTITLEPGYYYFIEKDAPRDYLINREKHEFEIKPNGRPVTLNFSNIKKDDPSIIKEVGTETIPFSSEKINLAALETPFSYKIRTVIPGQLIEEKAETNGINRLSTTEKTFKSLVIPLPVNPIEKSVELPTCPIVELPTCPIKEVKTDKYIIKDTINELIEIQDVRATVNGQKLDVKRDGQNIEIVYEKEDTLLTDTIEIIIDAKINREKYEAKYGKKGNIELLNIANLEFEGKVKHTTPVVVVTPPPEKPKEGILRFNKVDFATHESIADATIAFYKDGQDKPFLTGVTNMDGKIDKTTATGEVERVNSDGTITLEVGKYYFKETKAPDGYILNNDEYHFEITEGKVIQRILTNKIKGTLDFTKTDEKGNALAGAKIAISKSGDESPLIIGKTGSDGRINKSSVEKGKEYINSEGIITLEYGEYELSEIEAPDGYEKSNEVIKIKILDKNIIEISLKNILKNEEKDPKPNPKPNPKPKPEPKPEPSKPIEPTKIVKKDKEYEKVDMKIYKNIKDKLNMKDHYAYMFGYPDATFRPERPMTRAEVTAMFARLMNYPPAETKEYPVSYNDIERKNWFFRAVEFMNENGIVTGYPDGSFKPNRYITRAEFATMASRFDNLEQTQGAKFPDVPASHWASKYINSAVVKGWVHGYPDGTFKPERDISRAEVVKVTNHMLERKADKEFVDSNEDKLIYFTDLLDKNYWAYYNVREATDGHEYHRRGTGIDEIWEILNRKEFRFAVVGRYKYKYKFR